MDMNFSPEDRAFREEVRDFLATSLPDRLKDGARKTPGVFVEPDIGMEWHRILNDKGWVAPLWPVEDGGTGWTPVQKFIFEKECALAGAPSLSILGLKLVGPVICAFGTPEQKMKWLPRFATGEVRGGLALTEPNAGTDLQAIRTVAKRDGDDYVLNGTKTWISNALNGQCFAMLAKTDPNADPRYKGMSLFIADKRDGLSTGKKFDKLGYKSIDSAELIMEDYRIPADQLIGGVEGQGFFQATGGLELGRINVAARGVGLAEGSLRLATEYAQQRETMGKPIAQHQAIQLKLGEMVTRARAARLLTLDASEAYDKGERCDKEAGVAKYFASEAAVENSQEAMRIFGGYSYSKEYDIERFYRDSMLMCIGEGTNEMQRIIIAKQHLKENPA